MSSIGTSILLIMFLRFSSEEAIGFPFINIFSLAFNSIFYNESRFKLPDALINIELSEKILISPD